MVVKVFKKREIKPHLEIERRWSVGELPEGFLADPSSFYFTDIRQAYISGDERIREEKYRDGSIVYTRGRKVPVVGPVSVSIRQEFPSIITKDEFEELLKLIIGDEINKRRFEIPLIGTRGQTKGYVQVAELNVFSFGGMLLEVENKDVEDALSFRPPDWFGEEVTTTISNKKIAKGIVFPESLMRHAHLAQRLLKASK